MLALTAIDRELSYIGSNDGDNPMSVNSTSYPPGMVPAYPAPLRYAFLKILNLRL
jgi:hypothetical protein